MAGGSLIGLLPWSFRLAYLNGLVEGHVAIAPAQAVANPLEADGLGHHHHHPFHQPPMDGVGQHRGDQLRHFRGYGNILTGFISYKQGISEDVALIDRKRRSFGDGQAAGGAGQGWPKR